MEQNNKIELRGLVGSVKLQEVAGKKVARITVATSAAYTDRNGAAVIDTQWHNVNAWEGKRVTGLEKLQKGDRVWVTGRVRYNKFTGTDGLEHNSTDILANRLTILDDEDDFPCQM
jgi:single-strand DNA-binding protein